MTAFTVIVIPMQEHSYCYYIHATGQIQHGYFIDPSEAMAVEQFRLDLGIKTPISHIIMTHKSIEKSGTILKHLKRKYPELAIMGHAEGKLAECTNPLNDHDTFEMFDGQIKATCFSH